MLEKQAAYQKSAENDTQIHRHGQPKIMTPQQYATDLNANSWGITNAYDDSKQNNVIIESTDAWIRNHLHKYWAASSKDN